MAQKKRSGSSSAPAKTARPKTPAPRPLTGAFAAPAPLPAVVAIKAHNNAVIKARQDLTQAKLIANKVGAMAGLAPVGSLGQHGIGRDKYIPDLTAKAGVAKANQQRLQQGGILGPEQEAREKVVSALVGGSRHPTFHDLHNLRADPHWGDLAKPAVSLDRSSRPATRQSQSARKPPPEPAASGGGGGIMGFLGDVKDAYDHLPLNRQVGGGHPGPVLLPRVIDTASGAARTVGEPVFSHLPAPVQDVIKKPFTDPIGATLPLGMGYFPGAPNISKAYAKGGEKVAQKLARALVAVPENATVPSFDIVGMAGAATNRPIRVGDLPPSAGLTDAGTVKWQNKALKQGWHPADLEGLVGVDLISHGLQKPPPWYQRLPVNAAIGTARLAGIPTAAMGLGASIFSGNSGEAGRQIVEGTISETPLIGKHPFLDTLVADPVGAISSVLPELKGFGAVGHLPGPLRAAEGERLVRLAGSGRVVSRGAKQANYYGAIQDMTSDLAARKIPAFGNRIDRQVTDAAQAHAENKIAPTYVEHGVNHMATTAQVGKKRAVVLRMYAMAGAKPEIMLAHYKREAMLLGKTPTSAAAGQAKKWQQVVDETRELSPQDKAYLKAHGAISHHTSQELSDEGQFGDNAIRSRRNEPLYVAAAHNPADPLHEVGKNIMQLRHEIFAEKYDKPPDMTGVRAQKRALETQLRRITKRKTAAKAVVDKPLPEAPPKPYAPDVEAQAKHAEDLATYEAKRKELKAAVDAEKPAKPKKPGAYDTRTEAIKAKAEILPTHPEGTGAKIVQRNDDKWTIELSPPKKAAEPKPRGQFRDERLTELKGRRSVLQERMDDQGLSHQARAGAARKAKKMDVEIGRLQRDEDKINAASKASTLDAPSEKSVEQLNYERKLKQYKADNPKPTGSAAKLKAWEDAAPKPPKRPRTDAEKAYAAHVKTRPKAPERIVDPAVKEHKTATGRATAQKKQGRTRQRTHDATQGQLVKRVQALKTRLEHHTQKTEATEASLHQDLSDALTAFEAGHLERGGMVPHRVQYSQPPPLVDRITRKGQGGMFGHSKKKVTPSTGELAKSGDFVINEHSGMAESQAAMRLRMSTAAGEELLSQGLPAKEYDPIPKGYVLVSNESATALQRTRNDFIDNPVDQDEFTHENGVRKSLSDVWDQALEDNKMEHVPAGKSGVFITKAQYDRAKEYMTPVTKNAYDRFNRAYQRHLISLYPSTLLGNSFGTAPMALFYGATHPKDWTLAWRQTTRGNESLAPFTARRRGLTGSIQAAQAGRNPLLRYEAWMRRATARGEDVSKLAVYNSRTRKGFEKIAKETGTSFEDVARAAAKGEMTPEMADTAITYGTKAFELAEKGMRDANKATGEMGHPEGRMGRNVGRLVLYHQWLGHVAKLMLWTMPMERPGSFLVMNSMARYGDEYRKQHGVFPSWMADFARVGDAYFGGHKFAKVIGLGQLAPQNTAGQFLSTVTSDRPIFERIASLTNPLIGAGINIGTADNANRTSNFTPQSLSRLAANQAIYMVPGMAKFAPRGGQDPTSIPLLSPRQIQYAKPKGGAYGSYGPKYGKWIDRPGVRPMGSDAPLLSWENALGIGSRVLGLPLSYTPVEGQINDAAIKKAESKGKKGSSYGYVKK